MRRTNSRGERTPGWEDTAGVLGRAGLLSHRAAAPAPPGEQRSSAEGRAPFPSCCFSAPSQTSRVQDSLKPGARRALPTAGGFEVIAGATPVSLHCQHDRLRLPGLTDVILTDSSFMSITAITTLKFSVRTRACKHPAGQQSLKP